LESADEFDGFDFVEDAVDGALFVVGGYDDGEGVAHFLLDFGGRR
jgi:hypothetical protein